jgi:hypothetical protein
MVAEDFLRDPQVRQWLEGVEPAWTLLTFDTLRALRQEPSAVRTTIRIANDLSANEVSASAVARNTLILLRKAIERDGLPLTATGNLSRSAVAEMCKLIEWPDYDQAAALQFNKVTNEPDFLPLHVVRILAQAATLVRAQRGKLVATSLGRAMLSRMDLGYFGRGLLGSWPQPDVASRRPEHSTQCVQSAELGERPAHLSVMSDEFSPCCNSSHRILQIDANAAHPMRRYGPRTHAGSCRSAVPRSHSAKASPAQWASRGCPSHVAGA